MRQALLDLQQTVKNKPEKDQVNKAIEAVHDKYQTLIGVFE